MEPKRLILCGGTQSSGSSLVSWCFLQRHDTDGIFDARGDMLPEPLAVTAPVAWCKITIQCFRLREVRQHFQDEGYTSILPLLVIRDTRAVFNSLLRKPYGSNGTTAEQPPLRLRLRRFLEDWQEFRQHGWPILKHEDLCLRGEPVLRQAVQDLGLPWDDAMLTWPKDPAQMSAPRHGSPTLRAAMGKDFASTLDAKHARVSTDLIPPGDLQWLESTFAEFNLAHGYPPHLPSASDWAGREDRAVPRYELTKRFRRRRRKDAMERMFRVIPKLAGDAIRKMRSPRKTDPGTPPPGTST